MAISVFESLNEHYVPYIVPVIIRYISNVDHSKGQVKVKSFTNQKGKKKNF